MMLIEQTTVPTAVLPVAEFKDHLRLGTGFADDGVQDVVLEQMLRAALAAVEARTGKALITRDFLWSLTGWRESNRQALPIAPVQSLTELKLIDRDANETVVDAAAYLLVKDDQRPRVEAYGTCLPNVPVGGTAELTFSAGFGAVWGALPADIAHAVFLLAAHYYEHRHESASAEKAMPFGVTALIARYRTVRILGGGTS